MPATRDALESLGDQIAIDFAHVDAAQHRILANLRLFDEGGGWMYQGFRTCAHWLTWRANVGLGTAREHVRVAKALGALPHIDRALSRAELSYCKVRALTRVATPDNEQVLLEQARLVTGHQLEKLCRKYASARQHDDRRSPSDDRDRRYVSFQDTDDGMVVMKAVLHPDEAAVVKAALQRIATERCRGVPAAPVPVRAPAPADVHAETCADVPAETPFASADVPAETPFASADVPAETSADVPAETPFASADVPAEACADVPAKTCADVPAETPFASAARAAGTRQRVAFDRADALVHMATEVVRGHSPDRSPTEIMISIPIDTLHHGHAPDALSVACGSDGTALSAHAARRLACDAGIVALLEDAHGNTLAAGRKRRTISGPLKRALLHRDDACRFPGCSTKVFLEGHHIEHWADGGETSLANALLLCSHHHRFVHEYGFSIELEPSSNTVTARDPHGRVVHEVSPPATELLGVRDRADLGLSTITRRNTRVEITADNLECWDGTPVDYHELVAWTLQADTTASERVQRSPTLH